jgi:hypothetical protein
MSAAAAATMQLLLLLLLFSTSAITARLGAVHRYVSGFWVQAAQRLGLGAIGGHGKSLTCQ